MTRSSQAAILAVAMVVGIPRSAPVWAQDRIDFAGRWTINRELSQFPPEVGFGLSWPSARGSDVGSTGGGRGRHGSGGGGAGIFTGRPESEDDVKRVQQQPDAELKGLTKLGVVVEELNSQAASCGLNQGTLETAVSKHLSDAGFKVLRNSDEDSYVYVNIMTSRLSNGLCVSRYDVFVYTHTTARLSYQETPVLVQVSLLHKGGIAGGAAAAHAADVLTSVQEYVDQFATRIREANK